MSDELLPVDHRLMGVLLTYGPRGIFPSVPELAGKLGCTPRWARKRLKHLERLGLVLRLPVYERPEDPPWVERGREILHPGRQTSNTYMLKPGNGSKPPAQPPRSCPTRPETDSPVSSGAPRNCEPVHKRGKSAAQPPGSGVSSGGSASSALEQPEGDHSPEEGVPPPVAGTSGAVLRHRQGGILTSVTIPDDGWPEEPAEAEAQETEAAGHRGAVRLVVPQRDQLDYDPTAAQILATIAAGLDEVGTVELRPHPTYPVARHGKVNLETCSTTDLHRALQGLDRDTCINSGCRPGARCPRHTPRKRG